MELHASELTEANYRLREESEENKLVFKKLRESLLTLREEETDTKEIFKHDDLNLLSIAELLKKESERRKDAEWKLLENIRQLEKINKELDQFTYIVSHDLKAPLRAISSLATFLEEDLAQIMNEEAKENFGLLKNRVARMENFINGLLEYSRAAKSVNTEMVDTEQLISEIIDLLNAPEHIKIKVIENLPVLKTDKIRMEQLFSNLISNAIRYNDKEEGIIEIGCTEFEDWCQFYIRDNGPGIEKQFQEKIFELFQTLQTKDKNESTGIGLAIVKKIMEEAGGKIWVESEKNKGSRFVFTYPKLKSIEFIKTH